MTNKLTSEDAKAFLECAKQDIIASRILYKNKIYSLSVFHLQQSVEKLLKALLIHNGICDLDDLKEISHDSWRAMEVLSTRASHQIPFKEQNKKQELVPGLTSIIKKNPELVATMSYDEIISMIEKTEEIRIYLLKSLLKSLDNGFGDSVLSKRKRKKVAIDFLNAMATIITASLIISPHETYARYPDGPLKPSHYTPDLGIVKATPFLVKRISMLIKIVGIIIK